MAQIKLTGDKYIELYNALSRAEGYALNGHRSQVWLDIKQSKILVTSFGFHEGYENDPEKDNYLKLWSTEPHTLKSMYQNKKGYEDYKWDKTGYPVEYADRVGLKNFYLSGSSNEFDIDLIIDDICDEFDIYIDPGEDHYEDAEEISNLVYGIYEARKKKEEGTLTKDDIIQVHAMQDRLKVFAERIGVTDDHTSSRDEIHSSL